MHYRDAGRRELKGPLNALYRQTSHLNSFLQISCIQWKTESKWAVIAFLNQKMGVAQYSAQ